MTQIRLREYQAADMDAVLRLWDEVRAEDAEPVYALAEVLASCEKDHAVVAVDGDQVLGVGVARAAHDQGWIVFLAVLRELGGRILPRDLGLDRGHAHREGAARAPARSIADLDHVIVVIDEVEEIAGQRGGEPPSAMQGATNELLKIIPALRDSPGRLLICATNFIRALDAAFLRHGRFDYVIPIGLPDAAAGEAIWSRYIPDAVEGEVDLAQLVARTDGYSPADIEFAARSASQAALEQSVYGVDGAAVRGPSTADYLGAIDRTRATVSATEAAEFREDIAALARA